MSTSGVQSAGEEKGTGQICSLPTRLALVAVTAASLALSGLVVANSPNPYGTLEEQYTDHLRHQRYAVEFLRKGLGIYSQYAGSLSRFGLEDERTYIWPEVAYPYPLGVILVHLPAGVLTYHLRADPVQVNRWLVFVYATLAHMSLFIFTHDLLLGRHRGNRYIAVGIVAVFWLGMLVWSLNAQYEPLPVLLILLAARRYWQREYTATVALMSIAMFLKYQAVVFAPLLAASLWYQARPRWQGLLNRAVLLLAGVVTANLVTFALGYYYARLPHTNLININALLSGQFMPSGVSLLLVLSVTLTLSAYLVVRRSWPMAFNVLFVIAVLAAYPQMQGWYMLWIFPLTVYVQGEQRDSVGFWAIALAFLLYQLPDPLHVSGLLGI